MTSILLAIAVLCVMALIVALLFRPYDYGARNRITANDDTLPAGAEEDDDETRWRTVKVRPGLIACKHAGDIQHHLFLSREAPELPLPHCSETDCRCHYVFHDDRRSGVDRRAQMDRVERLLSSRRDDRRRSPGRRADDLAPA